MTSLDHIEIGGSGCCHFSSSFHIVAIGVTGASFTSGFRMFHKRRFKIRNEFIKNNN